MIIHFVYLVKLMETSRIILGLRSAGWSEKDICDFIIFIATGDENYPPVRAGDNVQ